MHKISSARETNCKQNYDGAVDAYERAAGVLYYVISTDPEWRSNKRGIDDDVLVLKDAQEDNEEAIALRVSCLLNIAASKLKLRQFSDAKVACDSVLELDPSNVKALYRRAQAAVTPVGAGGFEVDSAITDLQAAARIEPQHAEVRSLLSRLVQERQIQRTKDRAHFDGMFESGAERTNENSSDLEDAVLDKYRHRIAAMNDSDSLEQRIEDALMLRDLYRRNGKEEEAEKLHKHIQEAKRALKDGGKAPAVDFSTPDDKMLSDAKKYGIDLNDPAVQHELKRLEQKRQKGDPLDAPDIPVTKSSAFSWKVFAGVLAASMAYHFVTPLMQKEDEF